MHRPRHVFSISRAAHSSPEMEDLLADKIVLAVNVMTVFCLTFALYFFSDILEPSPPVKDYRFSVGQLPAWAKKQVRYFDTSIQNLLTAPCFVHRIIWENLPQHLNSP